METRHGGWVKNPKGILKVSKKKPQKDVSPVSKGLELAENILKKVIPGRNTNVLSVKNLKEQKRKKQENKTTAPLSSFDPNAALSVAKTKE